MNSPANAWRRLIPALMLSSLAACSASNRQTPMTPAEEAGAPLLRCPQQRDTESAPESYQKLVNPVPKTAANIERGRLLYERDAKPMACVNCHGFKGDTAGRDGVDLDPPPRNFLCQQTMAPITDGQMFWVILHGSGDFHWPARQGAQLIDRPGLGKPRATAMRAYKDYLSESDIWKLVMYIRTLPAEAGGPDGASR